ncbi:MAG: family 78 glycoside hydrolase catalytic domain [Ignavibacteriaceae bacterium]
MKVMLLHNLVFILFCLSINSILFGRNAKSELRITYLRCEYKENPIIDVVNPRLSWILNSNQRGQVQTAFRILVASSWDKLTGGKANLWDTKKVLSDKTYQVEYKGQPLQSRQICYWKVMSWDKNGDPGKWSKPAKWEMGLLNDSDWKGEWIGLNLNFLGKGKVYSLPPAPYLRKDVFITKEVKKARLYVTAKGLYQFYINGKKIGDDYLKPGWTDYDKRVYYQTYNVTGEIKKGDNAFGAILSYGWYAGYVGYALLVNNPQVKNFYGDVPVLMAQVEVEYTDGSTEKFTTDDLWKAGYGPVVESDLLNGETYDARKAFKGWNNPGFNDSEWKQVETFSNTGCKLECSPGNPIEITETIKPKSVIFNKGKYIFDMGQNFAGVIKIRVKGNKGDTLVIRYGEMINPDSTILTENLRLARATDTYILNGNSEGEEWAPDFTYHGFRFVELKGLRKKPALSMVTGLVLGSNTPVAGSFECSDKMVNRLYHNITWTQRANFMDIPTDCPQRDERLGWTGDAQVYVSAAVFNMDIAAFYSKWLVDLNDSQMPNGVYPVFAPFVRLRSSDSYSPGWMESGIICPYAIYKAYNDTRIIEKYWSNFIKFMKFLEVRSKGKYFFKEGSFDDLDPKGGYSDWLSIGKKTSPDLLATMYYGYCASLMSEMAKAINNYDDSKYFKDVFDKVKDAFFKHYVSSDGKLKCDETVYGDGKGYVDGERGFTGHTQTAYANAIYMKMLPDSLIPLAGKYLNQLVGENKNYLATGFLGVKPLLPALSATGYDETAYKLLLNKEYPSWGYEVENGATTVWERWNSFSKGIGIGNAGMNSFSHYSFGSVCEWMFKDMAGINTDGPAYKNIIIKPEILDNKISYTNASLITMNGKIKSSWRVQKNKLILNVTIPVNSSAVIYIPAANENSVKEGGLVINKLKEAEVQKFENYYLPVKVGSGTYHFESELN